jgi:hypothetical protein
MLRTDISEVRKIAQADEVSNCFLLSRLDDLESHPWSLQNEVIVYESNSIIKSALYVGANLSPLATDEESQVAFAQYLFDVPRKISSIVGIKSEVLQLWDLLKPFWPKPREIRETQPVLVINDQPSVAADPLVLPVEMRDLNLLFPACVSMFSEEVGISPVGDTSESVYRQRISEVIQQRRMFARIENNQVVFKAEVGVSRDRVSQIQGVWVPPHLRGRNYGKAGMAATVALTRKHFSPLVSLYVNDYNERARSVYKSVGFQEHSTFATVLF